MLNKITPSSNRDDPSHASVEENRSPQARAPELDVSAYNLAVDVASDYKGMLIALTPSAWGSWSQASPERTTDYLLRLAHLVSPRSVATSKRGP